MLAHIFRAILRPAHARPADEDHSIDVDGRRERELWEREREWVRERENERERNRRRPNPRAQQTASETPIELTSQIPITYGTGSPSTNPASSIGGAPVPVLDRTASAFPAHVAAVAHTAPLHTNRTTQSSLGAAPTSQPRTAHSRTANATLHMADTHSSFVRPGDFGHPSAEECAALAVAEATRQREDVRVLSAPPPAPSPVISDVDYRNENVSPGPPPSLLESHHHRRSLLVPAEPLDQTQHQILSQQQFHSIVMPPNRVPSAAAAALPVLPTAIPSISAVLNPGSSDRVVFATTDTDDKPKKKEKRKHHHHSDSHASSSSKRKRDKTGRSKDKTERTRDETEPKGTSKEREHKGNSEEVKKKRKKTREGGDNEGGKDRKKLDSDTPMKDREGGNKDTKGEKVKNEDRKKKRKHSKDEGKKHGNKHKRSAEQVDVGTRVQETPSQHQPASDQENVPPAAKLPPMVLGEGVLRPLDKPQHAEGDSRGKHPRGRHSHSKKRKDSPEEVAMIGTHDPEEERRLRKERRARRKEAERALQQSNSGNEVKGHTHDDSDKKARSKTHKSKDKSRHKPKEGEIEERSQRRAARKALKLAEAVKADNLPSSTPSSTLPESSRLQSRLPEFSGRVLSPVPEGSLEPPESVRSPFTPLRPTNSTPIPNLPELPGEGTLSGRHVGYTEAQVPGRYTSPSPAIYPFQHVSLQTPPIESGGPQHKRSYQETLVVVPEQALDNQVKEKLRHQSSKGRTTVVSSLDPNVVSTSENKEDRRRRKAIGLSAIPESLPSPPSTIGPPDDGRAARKRRQRTPEEEEARQRRKEARKQKIAAANANLVRDNQPELSAYQANALSAGNFVGLHYPDPRTQPGYGHYGYGLSEDANQLTSPPPGNDKQQKKSVKIDTRIRGEGSAYARDRWEKEKEEKGKLRKAREREAKATAKAAAKAAAKVAAKANQRWWGSQARAQAQESQAWN